MSNDEFLPDAQTAISSDPIIENLCDCGHPIGDHYLDEGQVGYSDGWVSYCLTCNCPLYCQETGVVW